MVDVPDTWPPDEPADEGAVPNAVVPVFVLPQTYLFPGQVLALNVFEDRYRAMVEDILDGPGRIIIAGVDAPQNRSRSKGSEDDAPPPLRRIAGLGEVARHEKQDDGRYHIWLGGIARVHIEEVESERPYRVASCRVAGEVPPSAETVSELRGPLIEALTARLNDSIELGDDVPIGLLSDILSQCIRELPREEQGDLFEEPNIAKRAERALEAHRRYPSQDE